jgi:hypothetical protein
MPNIVIRSFDSQYDPRTSSIQRAFLTMGEDCLVLDWSNEPPLKGIVRFPRQRRFSQGPKQLISHLKFNQWLYRSLSREKPKIVVCIDVETSIGPIFYKLIQTIKKKKTTIVLDVADSLTSKSQNPLFRAPAYITEKLAIACSDIVVFPSIARVPSRYKNKFQIIQNVFLSRSLVSELRPLKKEKNSIFYGGLLLKDRGIDKLLSLATSLDFQVIVAGYGELEEKVTSFAAQNSKITFVGKLDFMKMASLRANCEFSWCWYDQSVSGNRNHASGKILESIQLGSIPISNVLPTSLSSLGVNLEKRVLFVTEDNLIEQILNCERETPEEMDMTSMKTTEERYALLLEGIRV